MSASLIAGADLIRNQDTFGDWLNVNDNTAQDVISTAFFAWSAFRFPCWSHL